MSLINGVLQHVQCESQGKRLINTFNHNQVNDLLGEIYGAIFWYQKKASFSSLTSKSVAYLKRISKYCLKRLHKDNFDIEMTELGTRIDRSFDDLDIHGFERKLFQTKGWETMLCLDSFHCYWINMDSFQIVSYCEHDVVMRTAICKKALIQERKSITKWYKDNY